MDGKGYPFGIDGSKLSIGSRIMAVADVFTAITEERPYRTGMSQQQAISALINMADNGVLDKKIGGLAVENYISLRQACLANQNRVAKEYEEFRTNFFNT